MTTPVAAEHSLEGAQPSSLIFMSIAIIMDIVILKIISLI